MSSLNQVNLIGRLGADPETKYLPSGDAVTNVRLATSETWKDKNSGEKKEATEWHTVEFFGRLAEVAGEYLKKGALIYVSGSIRTQKWQDKDGNDRYTTKIRASEMKMLDSKQDGEGGRDSNNGGQQRQQRPAQSGGQRQAPAKQSGGFSDMDDDVPF